MSRIYLDCFLYPPEEIVEFALDLNRFLVSEYNSEIDFSKGLEPHVTVFMGLFPKESEREIKSELGFYFSDIKPFRLSTDGFIHSPSGYFFWNIKLNDDLHNIHNEILELLNPFREGLVRDKYEKELDSYKIAERENIRKYGFPFVKKLFQPHLTVGKFSASRQVSLPERFLKSAAIEAMTTKAGIGLVGNNGAVIETSEFFRLTQI